MYHSLTKIAWHRQLFSRDLFCDLIENTPSIDIFRNIYPEKEEVMQRNISAAMWAGLVLCFSIIPGLVSAGPPDNYTATLVMEGMSMPIARMGDKMRSENPMMQGMVSLHLNDAQKTIMMSSANKTYMEQSNDAKTAPSLDDPRVVVDKKQIGSETIDGHPCTKYDSVFYLKDNPSEKYKAVLWEAQDLGGLIIRNETTLPPGKMGPGERKALTELKDVKLGAAKASMFEVPKDYRKVNNMMEVMGGMEKMKDMFKQPAKPK